MTLPDPEGQKPVDVYIGDETLEGQMGKFRDIAHMTDDEGLAAEAAAAGRDLAKGGDERRMFTLRQAYMMAEGTVRSLLEDPEKGYIVDNEMPAAIKTRALTYEQGIAQVSADATLAVKRDDRGNPEMDENGKVLTILHGYLSPSELAEAQGSLILEANANQALYALLQSVKYRPHVEKLFESGKSVFFTPKRRFVSSEVEATESVETLVEHEDAGDAGF